MTELSPDARAMLDAIEQDGKTIYGMSLLRPLIAAALRALADKKATEVSVEGHYRTIIDVDDIHAIADELEAQ